MPSAAVEQLVWELSGQLCARGGQDAEQTAGAVQGKTFLQSQGFHALARTLIALCVLEGSNTALLAGSKPALRLRGTGPPVPEVSLL